MKRKGIRLLAGRRGIFIIEMVVTLGIAVVLLMLMSVTANRMNRAERKLADQRAAMRRLETGLLAMQQGDAAEAALRVEVLDAPAPAGHKWVRVSTPAGELPAESVVGLVQSVAAPAAGSVRP